MKGLAIRADDDVVHWAPFGTDPDIEYLVKENVADVWDLCCEIGMDLDNGKPVGRPKGVQILSGSSSDVTCLLCLEIMVDLGNLD